MTKRNKVIEKRNIAFRPPDIIELEILEVAEAVKVIET